MRYDEIPRMNDSGRSVVASMLCAVGGRVKIKPEHMQAEGNITFSVDPNGSIDVSMGPAPVTIDIKPTSVRWTPKQRR